ncbi:MAG TPA: NAD(P)H-dependent oxidoreductase [Limnobacter sp.]|nr:NAD(P)H-dependent oxidoreductase [Limnobacter sp.]
MKTLLIVYHSTTGATQAMAQAVADGARSEEGLRVRVLTASQTTVNDILQADAYVFAAPEMLGSLSGLMKDLFDRSYYGVLDQVNGRPYAAVVCAGSDGQGAARQLERIATGWRLKSVAPTMVVCTHAQMPETILAPKRMAEETLQAGRTLGAGFAAGLVQGIF